MQMAQEVLKSGPVDGEERDKEGGGGEGRAAFEGMEALARAIETGEAESRSETSIDLRTPLILVIITLQFCHEYR